LPAVGAAEGPVRGLGSSARASQAWPASGSGLVGRPWRSRQAGAATTCWVNSSSLTARWVESRTMADEAEQGRHPRQRFSAGY
jgi:hypothetical protein